MRMSIGLGVLLLVVGAVIFFALHFNVAHVNENALGIILMLAGVVAIILGLITNAQSRRTKHVEERNYDA
jgi:ATP/ADP translocase